MIRSVAQLPIRVLKRLLSMMDGERNAPSPAPPMPKASPPVTRPPSTPAPPQAATEQAAAPKEAAPKKAAPKKAAPKKAAITVDPQETPNPNAMKFVLSIPVAETGSFSFTKEDADINHAIAAAVIALDGVVSTFGVNDFLTVSKEPSVSWGDLMPAVVDAIKNSA